MVAGTVGANAGRLGGRFENREDDGAQRMLTLPPAPPLDSKEVQSRTNREPCWIIKHGIRNTGIPGFSQIHSDREIWQLAGYIRSLKKPGSNFTRGG